MSRFRDSKSNTETTTPLKPKMEGEEKLQQDVQEETGDESDDKEEKIHCNVGYLKGCATMASNYKTLVFGVAVSVYLLIGGAIFWSLERPNELRRNDEIAADSESYMQQYEFILELIVNNTGLNRTGAIALVRNISETAIAASVEETNNWIYASSIFFCATVVTTVGKQEHYKTILTIHT